MKININDFYQLLKAADLELIQKNYFTSEFFYLLTPRKKCNCNHAKIEVTQESFDKAYQIFESYNNLVDKEYIKLLKNNLNLSELEFLDSKNNSLFII